MHKLWDGRWHCVTAKVVIKFTLISPSATHNLTFCCIHNVFLGAAAYSTESEGVSLKAVKDDHTWEIESLEASFEVNDQQSTGQLCSAIHTSKTTTTTSSDTGPSTTAASASHDMDYNLKKH